MTPDRAVRGTREARDKGGEGHHGSMRRNEGRPAESRAVGCPRVGNPGNPRGPCGRRWPDDRPLTRGRLAGKPEHFIRNPDAIGETVDHIAHPYRSAWTFEIETCDSSGRSGRYDSCGDHARWPPRAALRQ